MYEKYLDLSMAGSSTIQSDDVQSILRSLVIPFPNYEDECRSLIWAMKKSCGIVTQDFRAWDSVESYWALSGVDASLECAMRALNIHDRVFKMYQLQKLLGTIISKSLHRLKNHSHSLSSLDALEQLVDLYAIRIASTMYRASGRRGEAISLLETVIHSVKQALALKNEVIRTCYYDMLTELAFCCAEEGHCDEWIRVLQKQQLPNLTELSKANLNLSREGRMVYFIHVDCSKRRALENDFRRMRELLRDTDRRVREFIRDNDRRMRELLREFDDILAKTDILAKIQERHTRLQEGSWQQETSARDPFLTDCIEWDKI